MVQHGRAVDSAVYRDKVQWRETNRHVHWWAARLVASSMGVMIHWQSWALDPICSPHRGKLRVAQNRQVQSGKIVRGLGTSGAEWVR